jgi:probable rRNA maturation factor
MFSVDVTNHQDKLPVDSRRIEGAVRMILEDERIREGSLSVAVVDDSTIQSLNRRHLNHDYPTDVLSFAMDRWAAGLDGEVIVSAETAMSTAPQYGWLAEEELLLYVVHGVLHLTGYDDQKDEARSVMRNKEKEYLLRLGAKPRQHP